MADKKKKTAKQINQSKFKGHYCRICGEHKANEKFSGKGHAAHICKSCAQKSPAEKAEDMTINKLHSMSFGYISKTDIEWLKKHRNDKRPEVREFARDIFEMKFPQLARNEIKQKLHIKNISFRIHGEIYDGHGDEYSVNVQYAADTSGRIIKQCYDEDNNLVDEQTVDIAPSAIRKFFNMAVHNHEMPFWEADFCREISYDPEIDLMPEEQDDSDNGDEFSEHSENEQNPFDTDDERGEPAWSVAAEYKNGEQQNIKGYGSIPDLVMELFFDFDNYFEDEFSEDDMYIENI